VAVAGLPLGADVEIEMVALLPDTGVEGTTTGADRDHGA
jgi:hypothetical protein